MASLKIPLPLFLVVFYTVIDNCASISSAMPPNFLVPSPVSRSISEPVTTSNSHPSAPILTAQGIKAAYWPSFTGFPASSIDTLYFTHIYYAFLLPDPNTYKLNITPLDQEKLIEFMVALNALNPPVKTLVSIGGGGNDPNVFSKMVSSESTRAIFINSTIEFARKYGFDGVDLDWEFPANDRDM
ncbi:unnamed protein product [Ilex paraguariensis]|uniref:GH18 domain-containing protein n=1 Tax=Ilex paraguariensis TaxID=185542 RepID=A0ABC8UQ08_9AQUA